MSGHIPVMLEEVLEMLAPRDGACYVDGAGQGVAHRASPGRWDGRFTLFCIRCGTRLERAI